MNLPARTARSEGQALPEFALVLPVFVLMLFAVIQFGMILGGQDALANGAREATRYASTVPVANSNDVGNCSSGTVAGVYARLASVLSQKLPGYSSANLAPCGTTGTSSTVTYCTRLNPGISGAAASYSIFVQVKAVYDLPIYFPVIANIVGSGNGRLRATASEQMRVETFPLSGQFLGGFSSCP